MIWKHGIIYCEVTVEKEKIQSNNYIIALIHLYFKITQRLDTGVIGCLVRKVELVFSVREVYNALLDLGVSGHRKPL